MQPLSTDPRGRRAGRTSLPRSRPQRLRHGRVPEPVRAGRGHVDATERSPGPRSVCHSGPSSALSAEQPRGPCTTEHRGRPLPAQQLLFPHACAYSLSAATHAAPTTIRHTIRPSIAKSLDMGPLRGPTPRAWTACRCLASGAGGHRTARGQGNVFLYPMVPVVARAGKMPRRAPHDALQTRPGSRHYCEYTSHSPTAIRFP